MRTTVLIIVSLLTTSRICLAQDSIPQIRVEEQGDSVRFSAQLRPLHQIAGAPSCFYTYFWELGDGRFSFDKTPVYAYRDTGVYQLRLYATNNYDDGKAPPTRPRPVKIRKKAPGKDAWASHFFHGEGSIEMKINRYPRPGEDFVTVIGYRNRGGDSLSGSIVLFYNERQFGQEGFALAEKRLYNREDSSTLQSLMASLSVRQRSEDDLAVIRSGDGGNLGWRMANASSGDPVGADRLNLFDEETTGFAAETQSILRSLENTYSQHTVLHFHAIRPGEEKFVFLDMNTLAGMIRDTNATVGFTAMLVPDNAAASPELYQMDMQVVASHDPNRILLKSRRINYRFMARTKELVYRVQFQNTGNGPARRVAIGIGIPHQLDPASFQLRAMSPVCKGCDSVRAGQSCIDTTRRGDSLYVVFNNIYLPGLSQQGFADKDSTIGFIEYAIKFKKRPKKIPFSTQAAIIFDHNPPVITNKATARFIKGLSPGIMVGYSLLPSGGGYSATGPLQFGYVLAPYAPSRPYFQAEAFVGLLQQDAFTGAIVKDQADTLIGGLLYLITGRQTRTTVQRNSFEITPLHYRYNIGNWLGVGLGAMAQINISEQTVVENKTYFILQQFPLNVMTAVSKEKSAVRYLGSWNAAPFADLQIGRVKGGPVVGIRYIRLLSGNITDRFFVYAGFRL